MSQSRIHFARRWSQGLLFHQAIVDCARAAILMPLGTSILHCRPVNKCSLVETAFLLLVTVSTVNLLTTVLNDAPVLPDDDDDDAIPMLMDSPQCVIFGMYMIWWVWVTIQDQNLFYQIIQIQPPPSYTWMPNLKFYKLLKWSVEYPALFCKHSSTTTFQKVFILSWSLFDRKFSNRFWILQGKPHQSPLSKVITT